MSANCSGGGSKRYVRIYAALAGALLAWGAATSSAAVITIDDFSSPTLSSEYVQSVTVMGNGSVDVTYDTTTNPGKLTASYTTTATTTWQVALLRDDYRLLNDGDWVQVTTNINDGSAANAQLLGGLYLNTKGATSNNPQFQMLLRGSRALATTAGSVNNVIPNLTDPVILRATRVTATSLTASYSVNGGASFTQIGNAVTVPDLSGWGVGVEFGNLNVPNLGTVSFDNLQMNVVPEPSAIVLGMVAAIGARAVGWQRRR